MAGTATQQLFGTGATGLSNLTNPLAISPDAGTNANNELQKANKKKRQQMDEIFSAGSVLNQGI